MKTTIEITDALLRDAKAVSNREGTTVRALVEEGLRRVLGELKGKKKFRLDDASFGEGGVQSHIGKEGSWEKIRGLIYDGRGS